MPRSGDNSPVTDGLCSGRRKFLSANCCPEKRRERARRRECHLDICDNCNCDAQSGDVLRLKVRTSARSPQITTARLSPVYVSCLQHMVIWVLTYIHIVHNTNTQKSKSIEFEFSNVSSITGLRKQQDKLNFRFDLSHKLCLCISS